MSNNRRELIDLDDYGLLHDTDVAAAMGGYAETYYDPAFELGERCWRIRGHMFDVVIRDCGNGWCVIQQIILPSPGASRSVVEHFAPRFDYSVAYRELARFFRRLAKVTPRRNHDEAAERLDADPQPRSDDPLVQRAINEDFNT